MELGKDTKVTFSLGTVISLVCTVAMGVLLYTQMASEEYVDRKVKEAVTEQQKQNQPPNQKLDTAIQLMQQALDNQAAADKSHDKNLEAFTRALEQLRE